ncbi:hypothetical protein J6590_041084 [Homalodisca vitripennis]|nr:hypothetical protein J6590_041084 [Homalodisca vitripennis]
MKVEYHTWASKQAHECLGKASTSLMLTTQPGTGTGEEWQHCRKEREHATTCTTQLALSSFSSTNYAQNCTVYY